MSRDYFDDCDSDDVQSVWVIRCSVSGGVTGSRTSYLRDETGNARTFETEEAAQAKAAQLRANVSPYSVAIFSYVVEEKF